MSGVDTLHRVETPEGVELALRCVGPIPRLLAWLIDAIIRGVVITAVAALGDAFLGIVTFGLVLLVIFVVEWIYPVAFEVLWRGQTPGKRALGLVTLRDDGTPVDWSASTLRNLLRAADFLPVLFGFGLVSMLFAPSFKRLGDLAAGTIVVYASSLAPWRYRRELLGGVTPRAPALPLTVEEQLAVLAFAARAHAFGRARARELAEVAVGYIDAGGPSEQPAEERVGAVAAWLRGRRGAA